MKNVYFARKPYIRYINIVSHIINSSYFYPISLLTLPAIRKEDAQHVITLAKSKQNKTNVTISCLF